jgi:hypothetical protein
MKFRRQILLLPIFVVVIAFCMLLGSCSYIGKFFDKGEIVAPTIVKVSQLKTNPDYLESKEYKYNKDSTALMPLKSGENFLLSIEYENPKEYAISYVKINNENIMASKFEEGSSKTKTIVKLKAPESKSTLQQEYIVNSIFYNAGRETKRMSFNKDIEMKFNVVVEPAYYLTLNYQNADRRGATLSQDQRASRQQVAFNAELSSFSVTNADYSATAGLPTKAGGWVFEGYYTEPNGKGQLITKDDRFFFWGDTTLYAHYSRLFTYQIVDLNTVLDVDKIDYKYTNEGKDKEKTFYKGAIITGNTKKGHPIIDIGTTLVDEVVNYNKETGAFTNITATEYPIIKIDNRAFQDVNTMTDLSIGKYVEEIGAFAFMNCNKLERVNFANDSNLKYIGDSAFQDTKSMGISYPFALPDNVTYLGNFAFRSSGWKNTINNGQNQSILHIKPQYTFIGAQCFFGTRFAEVIFEPGCYFEDHIREDECKIIDDKKWESIGNLAETGETVIPNKIGAGIFGNCAELFKVDIKGQMVNDAYVPALNIIPDLAFDRENYTTTGLIALNMSEGVETIGAKAFTYQEKLQLIQIPATVKEICKQAFYNCTSVYNLTFVEDRSNNVYSQLEILRTACFGNMTSLVRVEIVSSVFTKYGNGPFSNCDGLKSIEFPYIDNAEQLPKGFTEAQDKSEVAVGHISSDFMYSTFETGKIGGDSAIDNQSYSVPTRIFCKSTVLNAFKKELEEGKKLKAGGTETGNGAYRDSIFLYDINLIYRNYKVDQENDNSETTDIALQAIYNMNGSIRGYNMAFWSDRTKNIVIPSSLTLTIDGSTQDCNIIMIGSRSLPTSLQSVTIPSTVTRIQNNAFNNCTNLTEVKFVDKNTLEYIGDNAFMGTMIDSFEGGTNLMVIGQYAFWKCTSLRWVDLSASTKITNAFDGRLKTKDIYIYEYEKIAAGKSGDKDGIDYGNALYNGAFQGCKVLNWIYMPPKLVRMSASLLEGCNNIKTVIIPNTGVPWDKETTDVGEKCFYPYGQASGVYDSEAIGKGINLYVYDTAKHIFLFDRGKYFIIEEAPQRPN